MANKLASTPAPPYYAVIFTSQLEQGHPGYKNMAEKMLELAQQQQGFLGVESAREDIGITVSYWESLDAIAQWKQHSEHMLAQEQGKANWYHYYQVRIARVDRDYSFARDKSA